MKDKLPHWEELENLWNSALLGSVDGYDSFLLTTTCEHASHCPRSYSYLLCFLVPQKRQRTKMMMARRMRPATPTHTPMMIFCSSVTVGGEDIGRTVYHIG